MAGHQSALFDVETCTAVDLPLVVTVEAQGFSAVALARLARLER